MNTNETPPPCQIEGCQEPRQVIRSGKRIARCAAHELARVQAIRRRLVVDEATGETVTAAALAVRVYRRKLAAQDEG